MGLFRVVCGQNFIAFNVLSGNTKKHHYFILYMLQKTCILVSNFIYLFSAKKLILLEVLLGLDNKTICLDVQ